ncbi:NAD(P)-dependent oxidoreductase [Commensalibacter oyaizuii]|uniref:NAD(P)-dependent oxidoreductase n=1 Tax=Commensalibacter oyaizuii TaxID=3043873 RepID=A0ABT6Q146_9PROT|nr:NAD(P)-dependent oxidoreductase [Commensalibacter sp. TBRC 16381]MDI2090822.1 NAD(P)-dependent oxidoreductase [Commensalibacter sp. TBRC 16381]
MKIAFIGLGTMGMPIVNNISKKNFFIKAWDKRPIDPSKLEANIILCQTPSELEDCDILMTMVPDDNAIRNIAYETKVLTNKKIWINLSTTSLALLQEINKFRQNRFEYHVIPVMGRCDVAEAGQLDVYYSGNKQQLALVEPILNSFSKKIWYLNEKRETALLTKLAGNFLLNATIEALGEAFALVEKASVERQVFADIIMDSMFKCPVYELYTDMIVNRKFSPPGFPLELGLKDINLIIDAGEHYRVPLPYASIVKDHFIEGMAYNEQTLDESALSISAIRHSNQTKTN